MKLTSIHYSTMAEHEPEISKTKCCANCKHSYTYSVILKCERRTCGVPYCDSVYDIIVQPYNVCKEWTK